jgi:hypothetical protein
MALVICRPFPILIKIDNNYGHFARRPALTFVHASRALVDRYLLEDNISDWSCRNKCNNKKFLRVKLWLTGRMPNGGHFQGHCLESVKSDSFV